MGFRNFFPVEVTAVDADGVEGAGQGMRVRGRARHPLPTGAAAVAAIRPDDVELGPEGGGVNQFRGRVEIVEYLGRENEAVLTLEAGPKVWLRTPRSLAADESVTVTFPAEKVIFLPREPAP